MEIAKLQMHHHETDVGISPCPEEVEDWGVESRGVVTLEVGGGEQIYPVQSTYFHWALFRWLSA